jgi:hypothetical protein
VPKIGVLIKYKHKLTRLKAVSLETVKSLLSCYATTRGNTRPALVNAVLRTSLDITAVASVIKIYIHTYTQRKLQHDITCLPALYLGSGCQIFCHYTATAVLLTRIDTRTVSGQGKYGTPAL